MSKIIVITVPIEGHFNPFMPIITGLVHNGHEVICFAGRKFQKKVMNTGATFLPPPLKWDTSIQETYEVFPELRNKSGLAQLKLYIKLVMFDPIPDLINDLKDKIENFQPDLIISDTFLIVGSWVTEFYTIPSVRISVLPLSIPGKNIPPFGLGLLPGKSLFSKLRNEILRWFFNKLIFNEIQKNGDEIRDRIGLPALGKSFVKKEFDNADLFLHTSIPDFEYPREAFPPELRFIGPIIMPPNIDYKNPVWWPEIKKDVPVVLINQGTVAKDYDDLILPAIEALKSEKIILIAVPVKDGEITDLPENVHTESFIPFGNILPFIDLLITNGGFGGTQNALAHGIPIIIAGATEDKMEVAARLEYSGAGINLKKQKPTSRDILKAYRKIMSDQSYKQKAKELKEIYLKFDAPILAINLIEEIISRPDRRVDNDFKSGKELNKMSTDELGHLFPVTIVDYNPDWPKLASVELKNIIDAVGKEFVYRIEHIGSTAVPSLCAKPTIDFLLEILEITNCDILVKQLQEIGYQYIPKHENPPPHMMFAKGYSVSGITGQTFHIHVRYPGDWDEIVFRDYLRKNQSVTANYAKLKRTLAMEFKNDREKYTDGKTTFIKNITLTARKNKN
jgi:MGT family glycosyltransferase